MFYQLEQCCIYKMIKWPDKSTTSTSYTMLDFESEIENL